MDKQPEIKVIELDTNKWKLPECCQALDADETTCPHISKRAKKPKTNVGL